MSKKKQEDSKEKLPKSVEKFNVKVSDNTLAIMKKRHLLKDKKGNIIEGPKDMFWRVASTIAKEDQKYLKGKKTEKSNLAMKTAEEFFHTLAENRFLPGSRVLFEAGNKIDGTGQLSSCFVLPIEDSLEEIFQTMKDAAVVQKNNGGTGFNFSHIRPKGDSVGGTPNVAAGPIHFIKTFSRAFDQILQGKKRGGGNMAILNVDHPDIMEFIGLKDNGSDIRNFNISVGITDAFMQALKNDEEYELKNPRTGEVVKRYRAKEVFDLICEKAWECADPGLFFLDTTERENPTKHLGIIEATNPCGEEPLRAYESCNLGSIVLPTHLKKRRGGKYEIKWDEMKKSVHTAVHFLDNMIDLSKFPLERIEKEVEKTRKLGLGIVGFASMLHRLEIPYNSKEATDLMAKIMDFIEDESIQASIKLAEERGTFPAFEKSVWDQKGLKVRNATMTSIAPTGTLSLVADTSSGMEPVFSLVYKRYISYQDEGKEDRKMLLYVNKEFEDYAKANKFYSKELMEEIAENKGTLHGIEGVPEEAKKIFVTTHDISPEWHVKIQAAAQKHVDAAVSKTINLPYEARVEDVRKAYVQAWESGCKGITIYRDGSKDNQVLESSQKKDHKKEAEKEIDLHDEKHVLTPNAIQVLEKRALKTNDKGEFIETPEQLWERIAGHIASAEKGKKLQKKYAAEFFNLMNNGEFYSGGTLLWAGMGPETILSKCLVLPIDDSIDSIFKTLNWNIQCLRRGVGTGFNFSKIRSTYAKVKTTDEYAAGPIEYLKMFNRAQDTIRGRGGRGLGSMAILNADHPNIQEFLECKDDLTSITHYNISVGASDKFMKAVKDDKDWELKDPHDGKVYKTIKARKLFEDIAKHAWKSGDPGMFFLDTAEKGNTTPNVGNIDGTNPCGEQPLIPFETCNLGHINLSRMVHDFPYAGTPEIREMSVTKRLNKYMKWDRLKEVTYLAVRFLDNIIDINNYPIPEIKDMTTHTRNVGVGVMGFADLLTRIGISYGSEDSIKAAEKIMQFIQESAHEASESLGKEKGNFPAFKGSTWQKKGKKYMRNTRVTTIAPTGTISIVANCNPGIEPIFALGYRRKNSMGGTDQEVIEQLFETVAKSRGFYSEDLIHDIADGKHLSELQDKYSIPDDVIEVFRTTHEIKPENHVKIQAAFQKFVDSAVSKTINLPNDATWRDIARVYQQSWETGCKGITVFRDGSKDPALQVGTKDKKDSEKQNQVAMEHPRNTLEPRSREIVTRGSTYQVKTEQGNLYVTINEDAQGLVEVFLTIGKSGSFTAGYTQAIGRLISAALRSGIKPEVIIEQLQGIRTSTPTLNKGMIVYSVPDAVAKIVKKHLDERQNQMVLIPSEPSQQVQMIDEDINIAEAENVDIDIDIENVNVIQESPTEQEEEEKTDSKYSSSNKFGDLFECPDCGGDLEYAEGCILCRACGYSKCG